MLSRPHEADSHVRPGCSILLAAGILPEKVRLKGFSNVSRYGRRWRDWRRTRIAVLQTSLQNLRRLRDIAQRKFARSWVISCAVSSRSSCTDSHLYPAPQHLVFGV